MPATSANSRTARTSRSRLPLTPKVVSSRRGGHLSTRPLRSEAEAAPVASTPAMHVSPNVVSAARGGLTLKLNTSFSNASNAGALDMRGLRL